MIYISKEGQHVYLRPWEYNSCRLLMALAHTVENHDGRVKYGKRILVSDRTIEDSATVEVTLSDYVKFVLDDYFYYYQLDDNPFFPFYYRKTPVRNGRYSNDCCLEELSKDWLYDCFFRSNCSQADIVEGANQIFNQLVSAPTTKIIRDSVKTMVPNTYDDGWHYENIQEPERIGTIDW